MRRIRVTAGNVTATALLEDTAAARALGDALPVAGTGMRWGDEIYFRIPVDLGEDDARPVVDRGDIAYWAPGSALCIFFGPTPVSAPGEIRPASPVTVVGRVEGDPGVFTDVPEGTLIVIERLEADPTT